MAWNNMDSMFPDQLWAELDRYRWMAQELHEKNIALAAENERLKKRLGEQNQKIYGIALRLRQDAASDPYDERDTCPKWLAQRMRDAADELRRMAEGEK